MRAILEGVVLWVAVIVGIFSMEALAEGRYALLIGNEKYHDSVGLLKNPHNDINLLEDTLKTLGFTVTKLADLNYTDFHKAIANHSMRVRDAGANSIGFIYYSGHGASSVQARN